jgi:hypothetical protein
LHANPAEVLEGYKILEYLQTLKEKEIEKSFPHLSFQLNKGARSMLKVDHIEPSQPDSEHSEAP